jgi:hypothetical protein
MFLWTRASEGANVAGYGAGDYDRGSGGAGGGSADNAPVAELFEDGQRPRLEQEDDDCAICCCRCGRGDSDCRVKTLIGSILPGNSILVGGQTSQIF